MNQKLISLSINRSTCWKTELHLTIELSNYIGLQQNQFLAHLWAYSIVLRVLRPSSPTSNVHRPASGIVCAEHNFHSIEVIKPLLYTYICYVHTLCAKNIVAPPIILWAKAVFNILIFFSETTSRWRLILCHYISWCWTIIVCSSQLKTPPTGFLVEL